VGAGVAAFSYYLLLQSSQQFLAEATAKLLSLSGIGVEKLSGSESPLLVLKLMNGSALNLALTWQRSGLLSIIIFGLLFVFLVFPLESPLWLKVAWLEFGSLAGLAWSFIRLSTMALIIYHFGANTEALVNFATSPVVDFVWVIPVWSLGLSMMVSAKRKNVEQKTGEI
jgi:hypothetical protein